MSSNLTLSALRASRTGTTRHLNLKKLGKLEFFNMSLTRQVAFNTIFQIIGKVVVTAFSLVIVGLLTRYLGVAGYGSYTTIFAYVSFWAVLADFGFFWILVRELAKPGINKERIFNNVITLKTLFGLVVFLTCAMIGFFIPQYSWGIKMGIAIISASWFWMSLNSTYVGLFQSRLEMYKATIAEIIGRLVIMLGVILLIRLNYGLQPILFVYIVGNLINFLVSLIWGVGSIKLRPAYDWNFWKIILKESLPLAILSFIGVIYFKIDTVILSIMKETTDVGIYGVPFKILEIVILIPGIFIGNVFPILVRYYHHKDARLQISIQKTFDFMAILGFPIAAGLIFLAQPIIRFIAGSEYLTASTVRFFGHDISAPQVLILLAIAILVSFFNNIYSNLLTVIGKQAKQVVPMVVIMFFNLGANLILIPRFSYFAAATVACLTNLLVLLWWSHITHRYLAFTVSYKLLFKTILAAGLMSIFLYLLRGTNLALSIIVGAIVYLSGSYLLGIFNLATLKQMFYPNFRSK